jgi:hydroxymethylglutaryl-CoA lyase
VDEVAVFGAATEGFSQHNINCSVRESLDRFRPVVAEALAARIRVRGYISVVVHCPYEGTVAPEPVLTLAEELLAMGCYEISLGDTTGQGTKDTICTLLDLLCAHLPGDKLAGHFHDTNHQAIANVKHALDYGLRRFDSAIGGLGGCPYAPGAKGNVNTLALHDALEQVGWQTGLNRDKLISAEQIVTDMGLNRKDNG